MKAAIPEKLPESQTQPWREPLPTSGHDVPSGLLRVRRCRQLRIVDRIDKGTREKEIYPALAVSDRCYAKRVRLVKTTLGTVDPASEHKSRSMGVRRSATSGSITTCPVRCEIRNIASAISNRTKAARAP